MKKYEKEVQQALLDEEKRVLEELEDNYAIALHDINLRLENLLARNDADLPHVIYQIEYQKALKTQVQAILEQLQVNEFETISEYLTRCYNTGFIGSMYSFHKQGLPFLMPIDQKQVVDAIKHKTKLKKKLYDELGVDIKKLQKDIAGEISRGISTGLGYGDIARNISLQGRIPLNRAMTIARTESHRIQCQATSDAQYKAKEKGADVLKQWDAALDGATRPNHRKLDGQIRELDEPFEVAGMKAMFPGDFGKASEDCNCRCAILQRARWALDEEELNELKKRAEYYGLDKSKDFEDFQNKYLKASEKVRDSGQKKNDEDTSQEKAEESIEEEYNQNEEAIKKTLYEVEESRRDLDHEVGTIINRKGEIINVADGEEHGVDVPEELLKDNIFTHNHPSGGCFTGNDIKEAINTELYELRASTPQGTYFSLKRNGKPIDDSIVDEYADVTSFIKADEAIAADYKKGIITRKEMEEKGYKLYVEYQSKAGQAWLKENAEKYGFTYESGNIAELLEKLSKSSKIESNGILDNFDRKARIFSASEDLTSTNPNFSTHKHEWTHNCQRCVPTYELRRRGYNVTAKPQPHKDTRDDALAMAPWKAWDNPKPVGFKGKKDIEKAMSEMGDGARVQIKVTWKNNKGHTFIAEQREGKTVFIDPQTGSEDCSEYFKDAARSNGWNNLYWRIDKLEPSDMIEECCTTEGR